MPFLFEGQGSTDKILSLLPQISMILFPLWAGIKSASQPVGHTDQIMEVAPRPKNQIRGFQSFLGWGRRLVGKIGTLLVGCQHSIYQLSGVS